MKGLASVTSSLSLLSQLVVGGETWRGGAQRRQLTSVSLGPPGPGTSVMQVMASDADDPTYGSSARLVYSVLDGEHHFTVDPKTGEGRGQPKGAGPWRDWRRGIRGGTREAGGLPLSAFQPTALRLGQDTEASRQIQETPGPRRGRAARQEERTKQEGEKWSGGGGHLQDWHENQKAGSNHYRPPERTSEI